MSSTEETESEDLGKVSSITLVQVVKVVKNLPGGKTLGVDEILPEMLKALEMVGLSWLTRGPYLYPCRVSEVIMGVYPYSLHVFY